MNKKDLAIILSKLKQTSNKNIKLEQYATDSEMAAEVLWFANLNDDIENKTIADLGCGNGILGIGALLLGAKKVYFLDIDKEMIDITKENINSLNLNKKSVFVNKDINEFNKKVDLVLENPPFGVQKEHADKVFLEKSFKIANKIYSFHKIESKNFIQKLAKENDFEIERILKINFLLKKTMGFHKKDKYFVEVGCWILKRKI